MLAFSGKLGMIIVKPFVRTMKLDRMMINPPLRILVLTSKYAEQNMAKLHNLPPKAAILKKSS